VESDRGRVGPARSRPLVSLKAAALRFTSASQTSALTETRGRPVGSYGTTWSFPLLHNGFLRSCRVGQRKVKKPPCDSLFKYGLIRPRLAPRKHPLTCLNRTDLVIHDPHRPDENAHLIRVRSMVQKNRPVRHSRTPDSVFGEIGGSSPSRRVRSIHSYPTAEEIYE